MQMLEWFQRHPELLVWIGGFSLIGFLGTLAAVPLFLVALPGDYLSGDPPSRSAHWPLPWRWTYRAAKNGIGWILILAGLAMLVLPGQGLLTLAVGAALSDIPGKRRVIRRILGRKRVLSRINRLRRRFDRPPLAPPDRPAGASPGDRPRHCPGC